MWVLTELITRAPAIVDGDELISMIINKNTVELLFSQIESNVSTFLFIEGRIQ